MKTLQKRWLLVIVFLAAGGALIVYWWSNHFHMMQTVQSVSIPEFTATARAGEKVFVENCAGCHGVNALGSDSGPPLLHKIYNPGHHSDQAFYRAVQLGSRQHHWRFGDMPPQPHVSQRDVAKIIDYVRELQAANDIHYEQHRM